ncbi:MAG: pentapeptide repeat-containing protein, partial [Pseudonocardiaceae bacterium]
MSDWTKRNARALLREFQEHGLATGIHLVDYRGEDLRGQTFLADESLAGADFRGADLSDAQFLGGVDLAGADLSNCRLVGARFDRANLAGARLTGANLDSASLIGADLRGATIDATTWRRARLIGALFPDRVPSDTWGAALPSATPRLETAGAGGITALSWHPSSALLAVTRGSSIEIWDLAGATSIATLQGHTNS